VYPPSPVIAQKKKIKNNLCVAREIYLVRKQGSQGQWVVLSGHQEKLNVELQGLEHQQIMWQNLYLKIC
jgi:hypothetical protein